MSQFSHRRAVQAARNRPSSSAPTLCKYELHGLILASTLELPELVGHAVDSDSTPDVTIEVGDVPIAISNATLSGEGFLVGKKEILMPIDGVGRYLVQRGRHILIHPLAGARDESVRLYLYGAAMSAVLLQRGLMPLHASAVVIAGCGVAFVGASGQGKSTLAASLTARGCAFLSDDKITLRQRPNGIFALPSPPILSLFPSAARITGQPCRNRVSNLKKFGKHCYLVPQPYARTPVRLTHLFFIDWAEHSAVTFRPLEPFEGLVQLRQNLNLGAMLGLLGREQDFVQWAQAMIGEVQLLSLMRPRGLTCMGEVSDQIIAHVEKHHGKNSTAIL
jgi:hypothetical protein